MIFKATVSNKAHPEFGQATIPFPIPDSEYDHTIDLLEDMGIGSPTGQDCRVDGLDSEYPILNRLVAQSVNVDELDYLAKRLDSFSQSEDVQFEAMACKLDLSDIKDFINLSFSCQQATVITDFSDLERVGKEHSLNINGGSMPTEEYEKLEGRNVALDLILNNAGVITPYGVVYGNGMKLEPLYDGRHLPVYFYDPPQLAVEIKSGQDSSAEEYLYLPCPNRQIQRTLQRAGTGDQGFQMEIIIDDLPPQVSARVSHTRDGLGDLNALCRVVEPLSAAERKKLEAVVLMTRAESASEVRQLAENLDQFDFIGDHNGVKAVRRIEQGRGILDGEMQTAGAGLFPGLHNHIFGEIRGLPQTDTPRQPEGELPTATGQLQHIHLPGQAGTYPLTDSIVEFPAMFHE